jgi:hypothetical protein
LQTAGGFFNTGKEDGADEVKRIGMERKGGLGEYWSI